MPSQHSTRITAVRQIHEYLTTAHGFEPDEADYLLLFDNPLKMVADKWQNRMEDMSDVCFAEAGERYRKRCLERP